MNKCWWFFILPLSVSSWISFIHSFISAWPSPSRPMRADAPWSCFQTSLLQSGCSEHPWPRDSSWICQVRGYPRLKFDGNQQVDFQKVVPIYLLPQNVKLLVSHTLLFLTITIVKICWSDYQNLAVSFCETVCCWLQKEAAFAVSFWKGPGCQLLCSCGGLGWQPPEAQRRAEGSRGWSQAPAPTSDDVPLEVLPSSSQGSIGRELPSLVIYSTRCFLHRWQPESGSR